MSIVSVHGPNMYGGTGASGGGSGNVVETADVKATADQTNGRKFTFEAKDKSRAAADYDWTFTPDGVPATATDNKGPISVTFASAGAKTATLTVAAGAGPPAGGSYPIIVQSLTAGPRRVDEDDEPVIYDADTGEDVPDVPVEDDEVELGFDPADYTVAEIEDFINDNPDEAEAVLASEKAGKNRTTLVAYLEGVVAGE
jgi:hypothetical protein